MTVTRYHPALVVLHWLTGLLIVAALAVGWLALRNTPDSDPQKLMLLRIHMAGGAAILALMLVRLGVRLFTARPPVSVVQRATDWSVYLLVFAMIGTGFATAVLTGLNLVVFGAGGAIPPGLETFPTRVAHGWLAILLGLVIAGHVAVALSRLGRMKFGPRAPQGDAV